MPEKGRLDRFILAGRGCACYVPGLLAKRVLILCGWHMEEQLAGLAEEIPDTLLFFAAADGSRDFTPWPAEPVWEGEAFTGEAEAYLRFLLEDVLPYLQEKYGVDAAPENTKFYLSLGDREPYGGPPVLRQVGRCTEELVAFLQQAGYLVQFEWNRGGHGKGVENRWRKALRWAAQQEKERV